MPVPVTALYAGLCGLIALALSLLVGRERLRSKVSLYDGGDPGLGEAIRRHANFTEHVPLALILLGVLELGGVGAGALHALGATLVASRVAHPFGITLKTMQHPLRGAGAVGTTLVTLVASVWAVWLFAGA